MRAFAARALASRGYTVIEAERASRRSRSSSRRAARSISSSPTSSCRKWTGRRCSPNCAVAASTPKIIFVSGYADDAFAKNLPEGEEFLFLPKPFTLKQLVEAVKGAMS